MSDQSDRILVSIPREEAEAILDSTTAFFHDSLDALEASLAAPDGIPEDMKDALALNILGYRPVGALECARDFVPNHQPTEKA